MEGKQSARLSMRLPSAKLKQYMKSSASRLVLMLQKSITRNIPSSAMNVSRRERFKVSKGFISFIVHS